MTDTDELHWQLDTGYPHTLRPELHRALMARGIDYWVAQGLTFWNCPDGRECVAYGYLSNGKPRLAVKIVGITDPAQAIAVTLGRGTCVPILNSERDRRPYLSLWFVCSECGCRLTENRLGKVWQKFCPQCGRRVKKVYGC